MKSYRTYAMAASMMLGFAYCSSSFADEPRVKFTAELDCIQVPKEIELGKCSGVGR